MLPAYDRTSWRRLEPDGDPTPRPSGVPVAAGDDLMAEAALRQRIEALWHALRGSEGEYDVPMDLFVDHVCGVLDRMTGDAATRLDDLVPGDIYLAQGCLRRSARATRVFIDRFGGYLHHLCLAKAPAGSADDLEQLLLSTLFLPRDPADPGSARLASYEGRGTLQGWLRVIAHRAVIDLVRRQRRTLDGETLDRVASPSPGPASELERLEAAARLRPVFAACVLALDPDERLLLRQRFGEGRVLREIAADLGVDTSNAHRRLGAVTQKIFKRFRARARDELGLGDGDLRALLGDLAEAIEVDDLFAAAVVAMLLLGPVPGWVG